MKFSLAVLLLLGSTSAVKIKSQAAMLAEIEAMSMNSNMHQVSMKEKTLLKTYLEVDMNEYLQQQMDSELFEGVDETAKSEFIGNFFHFIKCRFQDCNLLQTKSHINMHKKSNNPTGAESKEREDAANLNNWAKQGNDMPGYSKSDASYIQTQTSSKVKAKEPSPEESKEREDAANHANWAKQGNDTPAHNKKDTSYVQTKSDVKEPSPEVSKAHEDDVAHQNWGRQGNDTPSHNTKDAAYIQLNDKSEQKPKMVTNTFAQVEKELKAEKEKEIMKPTAKNENSKDAEPVENVQVKSDVKK